MGQTEINLWVGWMAEDRPQRSINPGDAQGLQSRVRNREDWRSQGSESLKHRRCIFLYPHSTVFDTSVQFSSVAQSWPTLCNPTNRSTPGLPVHHHLPEFTQTHVHRVSDAIQSSHPLSSPSPPTPNPSQYQSFPMSQLFA